MKNIHWITVLLFCFSFISEINGQHTIELKNPSFEDLPRKGGEFSIPIKGWQDCGLSQYPGESPPDIHPVPTNAWEVSTTPAHGKTFLGLVVRFNDTQEAIAQELDDPLIEGRCYTFSAFLARSPNYKSGTSRSITQLENFTKPAVLRIWGASEDCELEQLLAESMPVENEDWQQYEFKFHANETYSHIILQAFYKIPILEAYNGHVLVDGLSSIVEVDCQ